jgi:hypothetical protein
MEPQAETEEPLLQSFKRLTQFELTRSHYDDDKQNCSSRHEGMRDDRERVTDILPDMTEK